MNDPDRTSAAGDSNPSNPKAGGNKDGRNCTDGGNSKGGGNNSRVVQDADATGYLVCVSSGSAVGASTDVCQTLSDLISLLGKGLAACFCKSTSS